LLVQRYKAQKSLEGIETGNPFPGEKEKKKVTKHRNPWKGLKPPRGEKEKAFLGKVTKHRNPWKGLKQKVVSPNPELALRYKAQKSLEGIETKCKINRKES